MRTPRSAAVGSLAQRPVAMAYLNTCPASGLRFHACRALQPGGWEPRRQQMCFTDRARAKGRLRHAQKPFCFLNRDASFPLTAIFFSVSSPAMPSNVLASAIRLLAFSRRFCWPGSVPEASARLASSRARAPCGVFESNGRILPKRELLLFASEAVGDAPQFRASKAQLIAASLPRPRASRGCSHPA
jgi:hypothetical protein